MLFFCKMSVLCDESLYSHSSSLKTWTWSSSLPPAWGPPVWFSSRPWASLSHRWSLNYVSSPTASGRVPPAGFTAPHNLAPHHPETLISYCITTVLFCSCTWACFDLFQIHYALLAFIPCSCHLASLGFPPHYPESIESHTCNFPLLCPNS